MPVLRTCRRHGGMSDFKLQLESPDFVTFLRSARNYLIISYDYFYSGDAMRNE